MWELFSCSLTKNMNLCKICDGYRIKTSYKVDADTDKIEL